MKPASVRYSTWLGIGIALAVALTGSSSAGQPPPEQPPAKTAAEASKPATPLDHLMKAKAALEAVSTNKLSVEAATTLADARRRLDELVKSYRSGGPKAISKQETEAGGTRVSIRQKEDWSPHVPEIDRLLGRLLLGSAAAVDPARSPTEPPPDAPATTPSPLDPDARQQVEQARKHLTEFAVAASAGSRTKQ